MDTYSKKDIITALIKLGVTLNDDEKVEGAIALAAEILKISENEVAQLMYDGV